MQKQTNKIRGNIKVLHLMVPAGLGGCQLPSVCHLMEKIVLNKLKGTWKPETPKGLSAGRCLIKASEPTFRLLVLIYGVSTQPLNCG